MHEAPLQTENCIVACSANEKGMIVPLNVWVIDRLKVVDLLGGLDRADCESRDELADYSIDMRNALGGDGNCRHRVLE